MAPPALSDMTFSEQIRYLDSILLQLDPKYSPPELSPVHPLYTTVIKSPHEMEQVIRNYETRKRKRRGSVHCRGSTHCGYCKKQDGVVIRYHSKGTEECKQVEDSCLQNDKTSWWSISCEDDSTPSSDRSSEIEGKLRELRIEHCNKLKEFCERRAELKDQTHPEKKRRSLRKRLSSTVRSLFRGQSRTVKLSEQKGCVRKGASASSSVRTSEIDEVLSEVDKFDINKANKFKESVVQTDGNDSLNRNLTLVGHKLRRSADTYNNHVLCGCCVQAIGTQASIHLDETNFTYHQKCFSCKHCGVMLLENSKLLFNVFVVDGLPYCDVCIKKMGMIRLGKVKKMPLKTSV